MVKLSGGRRPVVTPPPNPGSRQKKILLCVFLGSPAFDIFFRSSVVILFLMQCRRGGLSPRDQVSFLTLKGSITDGNAIAIANGVHI
jgi:hypothetical protein